MARNLKSVVVTAPLKKLQGKILLPASKSISNRLLMISAAGGIKLDIGNLSDADDTLLLQKLIATVQSVKKTDRPVELDAGMAGTAMRFLTAWLSVMPGKWILTGCDRMKQRPIGILVDALVHLGASIDYLAKPGFPPLLIRGKKISGHEITIDPGVSSQFVSALLLIAPFMEHGLIVNLKGRPVSSPYMMMTIKMLQSFGVKINVGKTRSQVTPGLNAPGNCNVESDWSAAAFWYEAAVFAVEADFELSGLHAGSLQGDAILPSVYQNFGIQTEYTETGIRLVKTGKKIDGFYYDFTDCPDIAQPVIITCAGLGIRGRFEGLKSLQIKETDRLRALKNEIGKLGTQVELLAQGSDSPAFEIRARKPGFPRGLSFETYDDHRMAMSLAPLALKTGSLRISNPDVVGKSYPQFWKEFQKAGFEIH